MKKCRSSLSSFSYFFQIPKTILGLGLVNFMLTNNSLYKWRQDVVVVKLCHVKS